MGETLSKCVALYWVVIWAFAWVTRKSQPCGGLEEQIPDRGNSKDQFLLLVKWVQLMGEREKKSTNGQGDVVINSTEKC